MTPVIQIENVSKLYKLGFYGADTFRDEVLNFFARLRGKPAVNSIIGATNNLADKDTDSDLVWALKDINLTVNQGDIVGIIGKNGAGKSTLLKILSKITTPTTGNIKIRGRIASLLEVGTGMHQELTGRENIFLNGAILGMTKQEIKSQLDEIIDFAGIARYIDTPIKRYSSGMRVRLGFAIAAHLDPEILIVDEVLAVGDAEFQKRAIGKMQDISKGEGRTVLFVSHNMTSIKNLCKRGVLMKNGEIEATGDINEIVALYQTSNSSEGNKNNHWTIENAPGENGIKVKYAGIKHEGELLTVHTPFDIETEFWIEKDQYPINVSMHLYDSSGSCIFNVSTRNLPREKGLHKAVFHVPGDLMNDGMYYVSNMFVTESHSVFFHKEACTFEILEDRTKSGWHGKWIGAVRPTGFISNECNYLGINE